MRRRFVLALFGAAAFVAGGVAPARAQCAEQAVRDAVARQSGGLAAVIRIARPRSGAGQIVQIGEVVFGEPIFGGVERPGCTAVVVPYRYVLTRTNLTEADVFFPPQLVLGTAVLVLRAGRLVPIARTETSGHPANSAPARRIALRDVDGAGALEIVESGAVAAAVLGPAPPERAWAVRGSRLLELPMPLTAARRGVTLVLDGWDVQGSLPAESAIVDLRLHLPTAQPCYDELLQSEPDAVRSARVRLSVAADGTIDAARLVDSDEPSQSFRQCVVDALRRLQLSGADGHTTITVPLRFTPATALGSDSSPDVAPRITGLSGALSRELVNARLLAGTGRVGHCRAESLHRDPEAAHVVTAQLLIDDLGGVATVTLSGDRRPPQALGSCVEGALGAIRFPRRPAGGTRVQVEITLGPQAP